MSENDHDPREARAAALLARALEGALEEEAPYEPETAREVSEALGAAQFLKHLKQRPALGAELLGELASQVQAQARLKSRAKTRQRALFGTASLLAVAASLLLIFGLPARRSPPQGIAVGSASPRFPAAPELAREIEPGSDPLERLDPVYEAGLRGMREARFFGARDAYLASR